MNSAHASQVDSPSGVASWYTPGRSDGFGDRLLMFDNTDAISLELLRFRRELSEAPGFENAIRDRVDQLTRFSDSSFPVLKAVVHLDEHDLTLVSAHTPGQRLSELPTGRLRKGLHPAVVTWIVREVTTTLAALQSSGPGVAHGALNADRIILAADGRLCVVEHALGAALKRLGLTASVLWRQFGLLAPVEEDGLVRIDQRTDVVQLGTIVLSMLLARPVTHHDFERRLPALLDEFSAMAAASPSVFAAPLRAWLERALQLSPRPYGSAHEAQEGLGELPAAPRPDALGSAVFRLAAPVAADPVDEDFPCEIVPVSRVADAKPLRLQAVREFPAPVTESATPRAVPPEAPVTPARQRRWKRGYTISIVAMLVAVAVVEGAIIRRLGGMQQVVLVAAPAAPAPPQRPGGAEPVAAATTTVVHVKEGPRSDTADAIAQAAARQRSGAVRLSSPIELTVFEGDRVLGSTADGPIVTTAGTHRLDLVNSALGYRAQQTVVIRAGVITPVALTPPTGRININAQPWAQVLIDDNPIGDTPLANVSVPLGEHQVTFRHPQLGERRETVTVRADTIARVSTSFQR